MVELADIAPNYREAESLDVLCKSRTFKQRTQQLKRSVDGRVAAASGGKLCMCVELFLGYGQKLLRDQAQVAEVCLKDQQMGGHSCRAV